MDRSGGGAWGPAGREGSRKTMVAPFQVEVISYVDDAHFLPSAV